MCQLFSPLGLCAGAELNPAAPAVLCVHPRRSRSCAMAAAQGAEALRQDCSCALHLFLFFSFDRQEAINDLYFE